MKKSKNAKKSTKKAKSLHKKASKPKMKKSKTKIHAKPKKMAHPKKAPKMKKASKVKFVREARHEKKMAPVRDITASARDIINELKETQQPHYSVVETEVELPRAPVVLDKVYLQRISFEVSGIRLAIERMNKQLDKLERELNSASKGD